MSVAVPAIISALDSFFDNNTDVEADILAWLQRNLKSIDYNDKELFKQWFKEKNRCSICGKKMLTTYRIDRTINPPAKKLYQFCPDCFV